ncbi:MAG: CBS domain-containing protein, partial [Planctomycetota bacterium]
RMSSLISLTPESLIGEAVELMRNEEVSKIPILNDGIPVGSVRESLIIEQMLLGENELGRKISDIMEEPFPVVEEGTTADTIFSMLASRPSAAVLVKTVDGLRIVTKYDMIHSVSGRRS